MGFRLANEVLDNAPDDLGPAERLVLSVLAGCVINEATRECSPGLNKLVKRTGLKPDSLRKTFQRLAQRGLDPRVPIGVDRRGRQVFAHESTRTTYRIPAFERRDDDPSTEAGQASPLSETRGGTVIPKRRDDDPSVAGRSSRPKEGRKKRTTAAADAAREHAADSDDTAARDSPPKTPGKHQVADDLTAAFWERHGHGRAQPFIAVRGVIRTAIGNGVPRDDLARALDHVAREGRSISGATLDIALGHLRQRASTRGGARSQTPAHNQPSQGVIL